jgi:MerR family transcriptional regulator, redox-sensitive transcriptional activator SoxR
MDPAAELLQIGDVARASGRAASSIRYYERIGLIPAPRRVSGRRRYPRAVLRTLAIIDTAQRAGLSLDEIRPLLALPPGDPAGSERLRLVAAGKLPEARALIERAELVGRWLEAAAGCACPSLDDCQLFAEPDRLPAAGGDPNPGAD